MIDKTISSTGASSFRVNSFADKKSKNEASPVEEQSEEREEGARYQSYPFVERRSGKDRRQQKQKRVIYDMRQSAGRRKTDRKYPTIEIDA